MIPWSFKWFERILLRFCISSSCFFVWLSCSWESMYAADERSSSKRKYVHELRSISRSLWSRLIWRSIYPSPLFELYSCKTPFQQQITRFSLISSLFQHFQPIPALLRTVPDCLSEYLRHFSVRWQESIEILNDELTVFGQNQIIYVQQATVFENNLLCWLLGDKCTVDQLILKLFWWGGSFTCVCCNETSALTCLIIVVSLSATIFEKSWWLRSRCCSKRGIDSVFVLQS